MRSIAGTRTTKWFFMCALSVWSSAQAYELETHKKITERVFDQSVLPDATSSPLLDLGIEDWMLAQFYSRPVTFTESSELLNARDILSSGARYEDDLLPYPRVLNHFFDPQQNGKGLTVSGVTLGSPSVEWVLGDAGQDPPRQKYSLNVGREHHWKAISERKLGDRRTNVGVLLEILGRSVHHLQDMAQPSHTRNDDHLPTEFDFYEAFTNQWFATRAVPSAPPYGTPGVGLDKFDRAEKFWKNADMGIAEFTSHNFVSKNTNFIPYAGGFYPHSPEHMLPLATGKVTVPKAEHMPPFGPQTYISTRIEDAYNDTSFINDRASTYSFFSPEISIRFRGLATTVSVSQTSLNRFNFLRNYEILLPRAVAYSVGFINHYFRGRLKVDLVEVNGNVVTVTVRNRSAAQFQLMQQPGARGFALFYDRDDGSRVPLGFRDELSNSIWPYDEQRKFSFVMPADVDISKEKPFVLAFDGTVGEERGIIAAAFASDFQGLLARPNYMTNDRIDGTRILAHRAGQWSARTSYANAGTVDWKGHLQSDVLTWGTSRLRYLPPSGDTVYMNGKALTRGPKGHGPIAGASIRYVNGLRILNVAKSEPTGLRIYSRTFAENYDNEDPWSVLNPLGWKLVYSGADEPMFTGVFFNASGTEGQYIAQNGDVRTRVKIFLYGEPATSIRIPASAQIERTDRAILTRNGAVNVTLGKCEVDDQHRDGWYTAGGGACGLTAHSGTSSEVQANTTEDVYKEKTLFCVDYRGDVEVFCEIQAPSNPLTYSNVYATSTQQDFAKYIMSFCTLDGPEKNEMDSTRTTNEVRDGARVARIGTVEIPWSSSTSKNLGTYRAKGSERDLDGLATSEYEQTKQTTILLLADARHDFVVFDSKKTVQGGKSSKPFSEVSAATIKRNEYRSNIHEVVAIHGNQSHVLFKEEEPRTEIPETTQVVHEDGIKVWGVSGCKPSNDGYNQPTRTNFTDPEALKPSYFSWIGATPGSSVIDSAGRLALSVLIEDPDDRQIKHGYRNILTDGDLPSLIPGTPTDAGYGYDLRLIR